MERITDAEEVKRLQEYILPLSNGGLPGYSWNNPLDIGADVILFYYDVHAMNGNGWEKYREKNSSIIVDYEAETIHVPANVVHKYISRYMDYPLDKLKTGTCYHKETNDFDFNLFGGFGSAIYSLEEVRKQGCYYLFVQKNLADQTLSTMIKISGDEVHYISNRIDGIVKEWTVP